MAITECAGQMKRQNTDTKNVTRMDRKQTIRISRKARSPNDRGHVLEQMNLITIMVLAIVRNMHLSVATARVPPWDAGIPFSCAHCHSSSRPHPTNGLAVFGGTFHRCLSWQRSFHSMCVEPSAREPHFSLSLCLGSKLQQKLSTGTVLHAVYWYCSPRCLLVLLVSLLSADTVLLAVYWSFLSTGPVLLAVYWSLLSTGTTNFHA